MGETDGDGTTGAVVGVGVLRAAADEEGTTEQGDTERGGGRDQGEAGHGSGPPGGTHERAPRLRRRLDGLEDGGDRAVGRLVGHQVEPGSNDPVDVARPWSCHPSFGDAGAASASIAARSVRVA